MCIRYIVVLILCIGYISVNAQQNKLDSLLAVCENAEGEEKLGTYYHIAETYYSLRDPQSYMKYAKSAFSLSKELNIPEEICYAMNYLANGYAMTGKFDTAIYFSEKALQLATDINDSALMGLLLANTGVKYMRQGKNEEAKPYFDRSYNIAKTISDSNRMLANLIYLGVYYNEKGDFVPATELALKALPIAESRGDKVKQAQILTNLGILYGKQEDYDKSRKYLYLAMEIITELNDIRGLTYVYSNLAIIYSQTDELDSALYYNLEALKNYKNSKDIRGSASVLINIGHIYARQEQYVKALDCYTEGMELCDSAGLIRQKVTYLINMGAVFRNLRQFSQSDKSYQQALSIAKEMGYKTSIKTSYQGLAELNRTRGDMRKAYEYLELYIEIKDSLMNESNQRAIAEMQTRFDTEKVEKENEILTREAEIQSLELKRQQTRFWIFGGSIGLILMLAVLAFILYRLRQRNIRTQLEKQSLENEQRMLRSQMNPHFIFNSMNSIQSYISGNDNNTAMSYLSKFARLMRGILEHSRQSMISLQDELETLSLYIELEQLRFKDKYNYVLEIDPQIDREMIFVPPMLIQPFVENAIKHGLVNKNGKGLLKIALSKENKLIRCVVEDNGIGRIKADAGKSQGDKPHRSLGMQVTRERMEALKAELDVDCDFIITDLKDENGEPLGTRVDILIPYEAE